MNTTTTTEIWNFTYRKPSFFTPARTIAITVFLLVLVSILTAIIVNCIKERKQKKIRDRLLELNLNEDIEIDSMLD